MTGLRPGEKLFEEISTAEEAADKTRHPKVLVGRITPHAMDHVLGELVRLRSATENGDAERIRRAFAVLVPEYHRPVSPTAPPTLERAPRHTPPSNAPQLNETQGA